MNDELTTAEAAELLKIDVSEIRALCRTGAIVCTKRAGRWFLSRDAVAEYLNARYRDLEKPS